MNIENQVVLITGANRGLGKALAEEAQRLGAAKVYAAARDVESVASPHDVPIRLDLADSRSIADAAAAAPDVTVLVNNAGVSTLAPLLGSDPAKGRQEMEVNYFGTMAVIREFAPVLAANGGGGMINVISIMAYLSMEVSGGYSASKAALWAATNSLRLELAGQGTRVASLALSSTDTDMMAEFDIPKNDPKDVARRAFAEFQQGSLDLFGDDATAKWKSRLGERIEELYPQIAG